MSNHDAADAIIGLYDRTAETYDEKRGRGLMERAWLDRFAGLVPPGGHVLDIGCGMGEPIAAHLIAQGFRVTGVDAAPSMIALCRQRFPAAAWHVGDMRGLALGVRFDGILAWDSFFHLKPADQRPMFDVFTRHAAPGAALMFTSGPTEGMAMGTWQGQPLYHASLAPAEYRALLTAAGFAVVDFVPEDPTCGRHTVWLAQASSERRPATQT